MDLGSSEEFDYSLAIKQLQEGSNPVVVSLTDDDTQIMDSKESFGPTP